MLQGSLDNFGLDEVLGLLADTAKTGRMRITGDRGSGSLWIASGQLIGSEASRADADGSIDETMFELLRFTTGNFSFNSDETPVEPREGRAVAGVLEAAFERLSQWREIEAVVPSLAHVIAPVSTLPAPEMTISAAEWDLLMAIGAGTEVGNVCERFGLGEVEGSRRVKLLVERKLITIASPAIPAPAPDHAAERTEQPVAAEQGLSADSDDFGLAPAGLTTDEIAPSSGVGAFDATPNAESGAPAPSTAVEAPPAAAHPPVAAPSVETVPPHPAERFGADVLGESPAAVPTESGFLDPAERAWNPLSDAPAPDADDAAHVVETSAFEAPAYDAAFEAAAFDRSNDDERVDAVQADAVQADAVSAEANEFSFRPDPPVMDPTAAPLRRATDALPPPPPPAPPSAFDQFDAPAPPPPAPPSPADLVGSERVDGAEARRLLSGRGTERYDADPIDADDEDDGSLLMQYLRDES